MEEDQILIGNAPCSWGSLEFEGIEGKPVGYEQMLDELAATGYTATELGDWGFLPTDTAVLTTALNKRQLALTGGLVPVALKNPDAHAPGEAMALRVARQLTKVNNGDTAHSPFLVLADENGVIGSNRTRNAGRITPEMGLRDDEWQIFAQGANRIAQAVHSETGLQTVFHHHCAGYVETPDEIARLLELTDSECLGLVFDTGHYAFGAGMESGKVLDGLNRFADRIWYIHFKDFASTLADRVRGHAWDYFTSIQHGIFSELGQGSVDFPAVLAWLRQRNYAGYITVEQDILPGMGSPKESAQRNREYLKGIGL